jgi:hypothetical protein
VYHGGFAAPLPAGSSLGLRGTEVSFQMSFSFVFVPELSPRDTNVARPEAPAAAIASNAVAASWLPAAATPAGSPGGPTITKSFHMIVRPAGSSEKPSATNCASRAGAWVISTSPCPARAFVIAWPVPTATTLSRHCG